MMEDLQNKVNELASIMRKGNNVSYMGLLPSESQAEAERLMKQAIEIIEEITGEEWDFSYLTWY